jgi:hypothetical protein
LLALIFGFSATNIAAQEKSAADEKFAGAGLWGDRSECGEQGFYLTNLVVE